MKERLRRRKSTKFGSETVNFVEDLGDIFQLEPLDEAELPRSPAGPNRTLTLILGFVVAATLAVGLSVAAEAVDVPSA